MTAYYVFLILSLLLAAATFAHEQLAAKKFYRGDKVFRVKPTKIEQLEWLRQLHESSDLNVHDFWKEPRSLNAPVDIHVNKNYLDAFLDDLRKIGLNATVNIEDLQRRIDQVEAVTINRKRRQARMGVSREIVGTFPRYNEVVSWLNSICSTHNTIATCGSIGTTYEKREIQYIRLSTGGSGDSGNKKAIFIEGGMHAREWLGVATVVYILDRLIMTYETDPVAKTMLDKYDWIIVPVLNADGYEYSRVERMWRKTRSRHTNKRCYGADGNRNYDAWWGSAGTSNNPCSELYRGPHAHSESETKAIADFLVAHNKEILAFFAIHTHSQKWLLPYSDRLNHPCPDFDELLRVANIGAKALMAVNGEHWLVGNSAELMGETAGSDDDYAKKVGIMYAYTLELSPSDGALDGFVVPETEIEPSGKEVWAGLTAAVAAMRS